MIKTSDYISNILKTLPHKPGCYQYFNENGEIIYVGKAKDLKKRVTSYFQNNDNISAKVNILVRKIADIKTIIVDNEWEALLLENNLIKKYLPKYNIQLKDSKTYPWICIKNEPFPRVLLTRNKLDDNSIYYGPYSSVKMAKTLLDLLKHMFKIRNCTNNLTDRNIDKGKYKLCLEYHIGNCNGPCEGLVTKEDYDKNIELIKKVLDGNYSDVTKELKQNMSEFASKLEFEKANDIKEKLTIFEDYKNKSTVVNSKDTNFDVLSIVSDDKFGYLNFIKISSGAVVHSHTTEIQKKLEETDEELLLAFLNDLREKKISTAKEILVSIKPQIEIPSVLLTEPKIGDKRQLIEFSLKNANHYKEEVEKQRELVNPERHVNRILERMKLDLRMNKLPKIIECFDNSNIQGEFAVAAMVQFVDTKPNKTGYRHFNIKTVIGANDFASMEEIILRRYSRLLDEEKTLPDLIIVDGGKGQLSSAIKSLDKLGLHGKIAIIGIAEKLEEIYFPNDQIPLYLDKKSETLKVIQYLRDEAHRFGITHHRNKISKGTIKTSLTDIKGIGKSTSEQLLREFKSTKRLKDASFDQIEKIIGRAKTEIIINAIKNGYLD